MFGKVAIQLKLVEGDSAGTVTAFYVREILSPKSATFNFFFNPQFNSTFCSMH